MKKTIQYKDLLGCIGNTPIMKLDLNVKPTVLAKLEFMNPGGSIKDRSALFLVEDAEKKGLLKSGGTIVEATSGNQGIALAMIGAYKGYRVIITVPDRTAVEKIAILRAYGAEVHICPNVESHEDPRGYHALAEKFAKEIPGAFMPDQYYNALNAYAHYLSTGPEIWDQTAGTVTHFIAGAGTCGTMSGVGRYLKEQNPDVVIVGVDAANSFYSSKEPKKYNVEGLGIDVISPVFDQQAVNQVIPITDEDAFEGTRSAARKGLLVGISSGAVLHVAMQYAKTLTEHDVLVIILADSGRNYLSKVFGYNTLGTPTRTDQKIGAAYSDGPLVKGTIDL